MNRRQFLYQSTNVAWRSLLLRQLLGTQALTLAAQLWSPQLSFGATHTRLDAITWQPSASGVTVNLRFSGAPTPQAFELPGRLCIDFANTQLGQIQASYDIKQGPLQKIRVAQKSADVARVVLDLSSKADYRLAKSDGGTSITITLGAEVENKASRNRDTEGQVKRIVVDPGHGGHDPGAVSAAGTKEKDIVLKIGTLLARTIETELGIEVLMTRNTDVFRELKERTAFANRNKADLFVSIHANASLSHTASGIETYYLNLAKTTKAAELAAKENGTSLEKVSMLQSILFDLMANYKLNDSAQLASDVQQALTNRARDLYPSVKNLGVKQGPFYVLVGAAMPSILVETAFVDHPQDEAKLKDPEYQLATAQGICCGIKNYLCKGHQ